MRVETEAAQRVTLAVGNSWELNVTPVLAGMWRWLKLSPIRLTVKLEGVKIIGGHAHASLTGEWEQPK